MINNAPAPNVYTRPEANEIFDTKADKSETYTKTETDSLLDAKADKTQLIDQYTKSEDDALLLLKSNIIDIVDSYSKTEDDALLDAKADKTDIIDSYSKSQDDAFLPLKANVTDLTNYVDLTSAQIMTGQKQFGIISASSISKLSKNDASILLAGGGDMLVSSLVTQSQLQEIRDIASGKSKIYVFSTLDELNDWISYQENVAKLVIGDNLYIVDKEVTDYWWEGINLKVPKIELSNIINVITTPGTAIGGGNAITDISIDGNVLTPAKNKNFVEKEYDQSISGQKTFNTTIHSVGIMVQTYDNSSVVCAGGVTRSIADTQSASYSNSEDDALLLLKADMTQLIGSYTKQEDDALLLLNADKTQLIDSYIKIEINNLLNNKTDNGVSYMKTEDEALLLLKADKTQLIDSCTKQEDDALLLLNADKTQLIDSYIKIEINNLLNNKADNGVSYMIGEDDALLLLKADNSIAYTKIEDDALLLLKTDKSTIYTKTEDDALLLLKADKTQLIDSYTKGEINNLLNNKANTGVSYTKGEDDALLLLKADKTQLIDLCTKGETNNLQNNKDNQSTTYAKTETDQLISEIDIENVDLTDYYNKTKIDELLGEKADTTELSNYKTLGTAQTINANKTFNNACRFVNSIDGMSTVTGSSFTKSGADNTVVLLGADDDVQDIQGILRKITLDQPYPESTDNDYITLGAVKSEFVSSIYSGSISDNLTATSFIKSGRTDQQVLLANGTTKPLSEFACGSVDDSNYVKKTGQELQIIHEILRRDDDELSVSEYDEEYLTKTEIYNAFVSRYDNQTRYGTKTFNSNVNAAGFAKTGKDDTSILLANGGDMIISAFGGLELVTINYTNNIVSPTSIMSLKSGASDVLVAVCTLESVGFPKYIFYADDIVSAGSAPHVANFRFGTDEKVTITIRTLSGTAGLAGFASAYINVTYPAAN
ncbi:MAG: hypothetical protein EZS28_008568 [Streblomastix strix]|uniref:Uncharacterized protein n=1 Tax=Streblomastix strix TaxID=222440 RepID=A0A5J4WM95_9EUKA|nr:MAG: hypothetical protein EZS28_008568 [Streblomastix strix]